MREQRPRQSSSLEKIRVSTGMVLEPASHSASSVVECEPGSPLLERPNTLPELNSRPASRVMKSFSCDGVGDGWSLVSGFYKKNPPTELYNNTLSLSLFVNQ